MKRTLFITSLVIIFMFICWAAAAQDRPGVPEVILHARFVYVTTFDGPATSLNPLPKEREAAARVQDALIAWGRYTVVLRPGDADLIIVVLSRPSEDMLRIYDAHMLGSPVWWKAMRNGLTEDTLPLFRDFQEQVERAIRRQRTTN